MGADLDKLYVYYVRVLFKELKEPITLRLKKKDTVRLRQSCDHQTTKEEIAFFTSDTLDGKTVSLNMVAMQFAHFLFEVHPAPEEQDIYEGPIRFLLSGREELMEANTDEMHQLSDLHSDLETIEDVEKLFVTFRDEDGEDILLNARELLYIESPRPLTNL